MRCSGGSASCRRICSTSARSLSFRSADRRPFGALGFFLFIERPPDHGKHSPVLRPVRGLFAANDIPQIGDEQGGTAKFHTGRARPKRLEEANPVHRSMVVTGAP